MSYVQLLEELPSWVFLVCVCVCVFLCSHSLQCLTAFRECLGTIVRKKGQIPIESVEIKSLDGTACSNYYRKCHFISESIIMKLKLFSGYP